MRIRGSANSTSAESPLAAYMSSYLAGGTGSRSIFSQIGGLLYIFDVESPDFSGVDMIWFGRVIAAICDSLTAAGGCVRPHIRR